MTITVTRIPAGLAATSALVDAVAAAKGADPLAPVTVVVPSNHVGVSMRRLLARPHGIIGVQLLTSYRLAELLGAATLAGRKRRPVSTPLIAAAVRAALADVPGVFAPVAAHPATETAFVDLHRTLAEVPADALDRLAARGGRVADVVAIHRVARDRLAPSWYLEADLYGAAIESLERGPSPMSLGLGRVIVHLPTRLSPSAAALLRALGATNPIEVLVGTHGPDVDDGASRIASALGVEPPPSVDVAAPVIDLFVGASDADDEVRESIRVVMESVVAGTPLERIALLSTCPDPYTRIIHEQLDAAGIPHNGGGDRPLSESVAGRLISGLLAIPAAGWRRERMFEVLGSAPVVQSGEPVAVHRWERASRDAGIVGGAQQWLDRLDFLCNRLDARRGAVPRQLRTFVAELQRRLDDETRQQGWSAHADQAIGLLRWLTGDEHHRERWPAEEIAATNAVVAIIERLAALGSVEPDPIDREIFRRTLDLELESALPRHGRFGEGILTGSVALAGGLDLEVVVIVGMTEGRFPSSPRDDSLVPDADRHVVGDHLLPTNTMRTADQHRQLHAALAAAGPDGRRALCWSRGDLRGGGDHVPSRWLIAALAPRAELPVAASTVAAGLDSSWYRHIPSFEGGLRRTSFPVSDADYDLADLLRHLDSGVSVQHHRVATTPPFARGHELRSARRSAEFTRFDGNLVSVVGRLPISHTTNPVSPSALEAWATCPHAYFVARVLGVSVNENPEDRFDLSPLERGSLVHEVLEHVVQHHIDTDEEPHPALVAQTLERVGDAYAARGVTGKDLLWNHERERISRDLHTFIQRDAERLAAAGASPVAVEMKFGLDGEPPLVHTLPDGRTLAFRGAIDRVDRCTDGSLHVVDYKTGSARTYAKLGVEDPVAGGRRLQLAIYALAARARYGADDTVVDSRYWFVTTKGNWVQPGYEVDAARVARFDEVVATIVDGIENGIFPARAPAPDSWRSPFPECEFCDPDNLGTAERHREWLRIAEAPELEPLHRLTEWDGTLFEKLPT